MGGAGRRSSGAGAVEARARRLRGAAAWWSRSGVRARVQGRRFREAEEKLCETDAWGPRKVK